MCIVGGKERGGGSCVRQPKSKAKGTECHLSQEQIGQYISNKRESEKMQVVKRLWGAVCGWCASFRNGGECKVLETHPIEE